jgi:MscS family membrane protein
MDKSVVLDLDFFSKGIGVIYGTLLLIFIYLLFSLTEYFFKKKKKLSIKNLKKPLLFGLAGSIYSSFIIDLFKVTTSYKLPLRSDLWPYIILQIGIALFLCRLSTLVLIKSSFIKSFIKVKTKGDLQELKEYSEFLNRVVCFLILAVTLIVVGITFGIKTSSLSALFGGLAIGLSLATQKFLQNIIGGLVLVITRPFKIDDFIETSSFSGIVENIGIFYTKIRTLENIPVFIPNYEMTNKSVSQLTQRTERRIKADVTLRYEDLDKVKNIIKNIKEFLTTNSGIDQNQTIYVKFYKWDSSSINILVKCYTNTSDYEEFLDIQEEVFLKISKIVIEEGGDFAFNSTTIYLPPNLKKDAIEDILKDEKS